MAVQSVDMVVLLESFGYCSDTQDANGVFPERGFRRAQLFRNGVREHDSLVGGVALAAPRDAAPTLRVAPEARRSLRPVAPETRRSLVRPLRNAPKARQR